MKKTMSIMKYTGLYEEAERRYNELLAAKRDLEEYLAHAPRGMISISRSDRQPQYYIKGDREDNCRRYLSKKETAVIRKYLQKSYDERALKLINREIHDLAKLIKGSGNIIDRLRRLYSDNPAEVKGYINQIEESDDDYIKRWESRTYEGKSISDYVTLYETERKEKVRSKSELNIANALAAKGIPYKYECPLVLDGKKVYPDFTLLNVKERRQLFWEHRGMMDDKDYADKSVQKIKAYMRAGFYPGRDLIITEETAFAPLGTGEISAVIEAYCGI